jgi:hyperosmotically inducible periplasmic protein
MRATQNWAHRKRFRIIWAIRGAALLVVLSTAITANVWSVACSQSPDNTETNRPGKTPDATRADQQGQTAADRELTRKIRKAIVGNNSLSTYAHNIKIISRDGVVTLKGPVRTEDEKKTIYSAASEIAGASNLKDELNVQPKQ